MVGQGDDVQMCTARRIGECQNIPNRSPSTGLQCGHILGTHLHEAAGDRCKQGLLEKLEGVIIMQEIDCVSHGNGLWLQWTLKLTNFLHALFNGLDQSLNLLVLDLAKALYSLTANFSAAIASA